LRKLWNALKNRVNGKGERGATLMIVAVSLIPLVGMLALVFDMGSQVTARRTMTQAADAGALAAAHACTTPTDPQFGNPEAAADLLVLENTRDFAVISDFTGGITKINGCSPTTSGSVTVVYSGTIGRFFAGILGVGPGTETTTATASWTVTATTTTPAPVVGNPSQNGQNSNGNGGQSGNGQGNTQTDPVAGPPGADCSNPGVGITPGTNPNHCPVTTYSADIRLTA
jgi:Flp pilus assembly protein TadG